MNALEKTILDINKRYKTELVRMGASAIYVKKIPFGSPRANYVTYGGIPIGKSTEFIGAESGGKTTSALDVVAQAQKMIIEEFEEEIQSLRDEVEKAPDRRKDKIQSKLDELIERGPKKVIYVDSEHTLDVEWAEKQGVDVESMYLIKPYEQTAEQVLQMMLDLIETGLVFLMVLDSVPMLVSKQAFEKTMEDKTYAGISGPLSTFAGKVGPLLSKHQTALLSINQLRDDFANPYNHHKTPGGRAFRHLHALRLFFAKGRFIDDDNEELKNSADEPKGNIVDMTIVKTKVCKPDRRVGSYTLKYETGIDILGDTVEMAIKYNYIVQSGSWFSIIDPETGEIMQSMDGDLKFQGRAKLLDYLRNDEELFDDLYRSVNEKLKDGQ